MIITMEDGSTEEVTVSFTGRIIWNGTTIGEIIRLGKRDWIAKRNLRNFHGDSRKEVVRLLIKKLKEMEA